MMPTDRNKLELLLFLAHGEEEIEAGQGVDLDAVFADVDALLEDMQQWESVSQVLESELSNNSGIDLIVTDLGGTLVKTDDAIMAAVRRAVGELAIPDGYADPVYDGFGTSIGDRDHDVRQAKKAGVLSAVVKTGGQAAKYLHKIQAQNPRYLLDSFAGLCGGVCG